MTFEIKMPKYGISMVEGGVQTWFKAEGEHIEKDEPILEFSENKAVHEITAEESGTLTKILVQEGETVPIGTTLGIITC